VYEDILTKIINHPDSVTLEQVAFVLSNEELTPKLFAKADEVRRKYLGTEVFLRALSNSPTTALATVFTVAYEHRTSMYTDTG